MSFELQTPPFTVVLVVAHRVLPSGMASTNYFSSPCSFFSPCLRFHAGPSKD